MPQSEQNPDQPLANLLLGVDVGTYSSKGVLTDLAGNVLKSHVIPHGVSFPQTGYAEQDADAVWWSDVSQIIKTLLSGEYSGDDVVGVALSAIGPCLLPLDELGKPLRPGILYGVDTRAHAEIDLLNAEIGEQVIFDHSLMALTSQAVGSKIRWLRDHEPEIWARTATLTTASSYLAFRLTGKHMMNRHEASHYMPLYDPPTRNWTSKYAAPVLGDPVLDGKGLEVLPQVGWSDELAGHVTEEAAALTGLKIGTPVAVGAVDALSEAISVGVVQAGDLMVMYGSTTFFILVEEVPAPDPRVWTVGGAFAGQFNLAAGMSTTGSLTRWFADELSRDLLEDQAYDKLFAAAEQVPAGANGLLMLPYFSGERTPLNDPHARGVVAGLSLSSTREDMFRAVLEGVGYGIRHNIETFREMGTQVRRIVAVGGGAKTQTWLQIVTDIVGASQEVPALTIGASYGNAFLAGLVSGRLHRDDLTSWVKADRLIEPDESKRALYDENFELFKQLYTQTKEIVHQLKGGNRSG